MTKFRALRADEIDCRVSTINEKGLSLLLYKDARCDMNILDETVGCMNWQRHHSRDNANCTVSIWDDEKKAWIEKEDVGTESNTEAVKGLASDSFKRACFNWGIGRELYTAPFIWIKSDFYTPDVNRQGKPTTYDTFSVVEMDVEDGQITGLSIRNNKTNTIVYTYGKVKAKKAKETADNVDDGGKKPVTAQDLRMRLKVFCEKYNVDSHVVIDKIGLNDKSTVSDYSRALDLAKKLAVEAGTFQ